MRSSEGTIQTLSENAQIVPQIAAVLDGCNLYPDLSAKENLTYLAKFKKIVSGKEIDEILDYVGLDPADVTPIKKYSTGMNKRLLIAQAIMEPMDILILDEPTNGLDEKGIEVLYRVIKELRQKGKIILITSHKREDIQVLCDVVYRMREGKLWQEGA